MREKALKLIIVFLIFVGIVFTIINIQSNELNAGSFSGTFTLIGGKVHCAGAPLNCMEGPLL